MAKSIVGLDISSAAIRGVEVSDPHGSRPTVVRIAEVPTPDGSVSRGEVLEPNTVAGALKELWSIGRFRSRNVVLGMGNQRVLSRDLTVPKAPIAQVRQSLPFQVQDMLPVPVGAAILDFYPTSEGVSESGPVLHGLLVAAVKDAVLANVKAAQQAGLNPAGVDLIPFAMTRALVSRPGHGGTIALIELGAETTSVVIALDGIPQFVRIIPTGGEDVTTRLATSLDIHRDQAELVKRHLGIAGSGRTADDMRAISVAQEAVGEVLSSLRNTINYYVNTRPTERVDRIVLAGGGARLAGLAQSLSEQTGLPVVVGDVFAGAALARSIDAADVSARGHDVAVAYGLAIGSKAA
ncbi:MULTISPECIES: type IV pilus assembly protein PilM [unclassified Curtobacterium]|uniref:type IV pilus assembly protein PilM n=1 Tax=unclassified Curtobacterium TaxID=257496 RepID=UPI0039B07975